MSKKKIVTNAMRLLAASKISFETVEYDTAKLPDDNFGEAVASATGIPAEMSFKTLVGRGEKHGVFACCIPVSNEADLKKLAKTADEKKVELVHVKELLNLTGYVRGGVSPIGMKKKYPVYIHSSCLRYEKIAISAGICGCTIIMSPADLIKITGAVTADILDLERNLNHERI